MSHLITGIDFSNEPILDRAMLCDVIVPTFKGTLEPRQYGRQPASSLSKSESGLSLLSQKLTRYQKNLIRQKNIEEFESQFSQLKTKIQQKYKGSDCTVARFFEGKAQSTNLNMVDYLEKMPTKINLLQKYNSKFVNYIEALKDAQDINADKENFNKMMNYRNNSPVRSPNFSKMEYVLNRLKSQSKILENARISIFSSKPKEGTEKYGLITKKNNNYAGKGRRFKTHATENFFK